jgi:hypothetical protein
MTRTLLAITAFAILQISVAAQTRSRVFDNFDISGGVTIVKPSVTEIPAVKPKAKKLVKKTSKSTMTVAEGLGTKDQPSNPYKLVMGGGTALNGFTTGSPVYDSYIVDSARRYNIDPLLIYAQMHQESSFKLRATSYKGASGLMQLMPATARRFGVTDIYDPKQNIDAGVRYMRWLLNTFNGDVVLALAGYNAGEGAVWKYGNQIPPYRETQEYVRRITARYNSISNPTYIRNSVRRVSDKQAVKLEKKETKPLTVYEPDALAIRLPDGRMRLVNQ